MVGKIVLIMSYEEMMGVMYEMHWTEFSERALVCFRWDTVRGISAYGLPALGIRWNGYLEAMFQRQVVLVDIQAARFS